jgi:hypothetical protein
MNDMDDTKEYDRELLLDIWLNEKEAATHFKNSEY